MRGIFMFLFTALLAVIIGCDRQSASRDELANREPGSGLPARENIYPLSTPPPGAGQPLAYVNPPAQVATPFGNPYGNVYSPPAYSTTYQPAGYPVVAAPYVAAADAGASRYAAAVPAAPAATYAATTYADPGFGPNGSEIFVTPTRIAPVQGYNSGGAFCTITETQFDSPIVPIVDPPVVIDQVYYVNDPNQGTLRATPPAPRAVSSPYSSLSAALPVSSVPAYPAAPLVSAPSYSVSTASYPVVAEPVGEVYQAATTTYPVSYPLTAAPPVGTAAWSSSPYSAMPQTAAPAGSFAPQAAAFQLVPAPDIPPGNHPTDAVPSQWYEIVRPGNVPIRIGRVSSTCVCVGLRVPKRFIEAGERALIEARIRTRPPQNNLTYGIYVNLVEPETTVLDADITIRY